MRALVCNEYGPPESLVIENRDDPAPEPGQIVIDVAAAGINFPDVLAIAGKYQDKTPPPFIPGNEAAGIVAAVGDGVTRFTVGDRAMITTRGGAFAEKCAAFEPMAAPLPETLDFDAGAGFTVTYATSYHALKQCANLQPDETVLVLGAAGGVGVAAIDIAKAMGARVIAAASSREKLDFTVEVGADETINYADVPLKETVRELTDGNGVDVVVDPVGGDSTDPAFRALAWHGRYLVIGFAAGEIPKFAANIALLKEASIVGVWWGTWMAKNPDGHVRNMQEMADLVAEGKLNPRTTECFAVDDYKDAFRAITERRALGKVVLRLR